MQSEFIASRPHGSRQARGPELRAELLPSRQGHHWVKHRLRCPLVSTLETPWTVEEFCKQIVLLQAAAFPSQRFLITVATGALPFPFSASGSADESVKECQVAVRKGVPPSAAGHVRGPREGRWGVFLPGSLVSWARWLKEGASGS